MCAICCSRLAPTRLTPFSYFLDLLEGKVEAVGQGGLRHAEHQAAHPYARADMLVGRVGSFDRHHSAIPFAGVLRISAGRKLPQRRMPPARAPQLAVGLSLEV
jgi:hypothetical protein